MAAAPPRNAAGDPGLADSIFTFTFTANSGDAWGGTFVADSAAFAAGFSQTTAFGRYAITAEQEAGIDLSGQGMEDGQVFVEWYRDAGSGGFLATRNGPAIASGIAGLGSESDAAWSGVAWDSFGGGGADQADAAVLAADSLFTWTFTARSGDRWGGTLFDLGAAYNVGDLVETAQGSYRITGERRLAGGEEAAARGTVRLTGGYFDAQSNTTLTIQDAGQPVDAGSNGLGSETGAAWTEEAWMSFGAGGAFQANADRDSVYTWHFHDPALNDWYGGWLVEDSDRYAPGQVIAHRGGQYVITGETELGRHSGHADGTTWLTWFYDGGSNRWLETESGRAGAALPTRGLGLERDRAWDGDEWDAFGATGTAGVVVENDAVYRWYFQSTTHGDFYAGRMMDAPGKHRAGEVIWTAQGYYVIWQVDELGRSAGQPWGAVFVDTYYDAGSATWLPTASSRSTFRSGEAGLGSERDWVFDGDEWDQIGAAGITDVVRESDSLFRWYFFSPETGDFWAGRLSADSRLYDAGNWFLAGRGYYVVYEESWLGRDSGIADGSVWVDTYYDSRANRWAAPHFGPREQATTTAGLGTETDWVLDRGSWKQFGLAGWVQLDL